eukprot:TRINITY_DN2495_c1_g1_i1.p1 TRINITY_DN2495_c1_g1~~TRINITY_DN2495_c1_g1_i1.p1  ORF type:complete len:675 (-),score=231.53 TRINITY_DN2495_c1_g1_i1:165-2189(-)
MTEKGIDNLFEAPKPIGLKRKFKLISKPIKEKAADEFELEKQRKQKLEEEEKQKKEDEQQVQADAEELRVKKIDELKDNEDLEDILKYVDETEVKEMDVVTLRQLIARFEKALSTNVEMRVKYSDQPDKFLDSELQLHEAVTALQPLAALPELFPEFVKVKAVPSFVSLLSHENTDIAASVVDFFKEMVELTEDATDEKKACVTLLVDAMVSANAISALVNNMDRLDEKLPDESKCVYNSLNIVENLIEVNPSLASLVCTQASNKFIEFLIRRVRTDNVDDNALYASEILSVLVQTALGKDVKQLFGKKDGFKSVKQALARWRTNDPQTLDEKEFIENLFVALCSAMEHDLDNQVAFEKVGGIKLLVSMLRERKYCHSSALKALDYAIEQCPSNAQAFLDCKGLKTLFATFMGKVKKAKKYKSDDDEEARLLSIITHLFLGLSDINYARLVHKFQENDYEKVDRLVELHEKYMNQVSAIEQKIAASKKARQERRLQKQLRQANKGSNKDNDDDDDDDDDDLDDPDLDYLNRMEGGLYSLQLVDMILGFVSTAGDSKLKHRIDQLFNQKDIPTNQPKIILQEFLAHVSDNSPEQSVQIKVEKKEDILSISSSSSLTSLSTSSLSSSSLPAVVEHEIKVKTEPSEEKQVESGAVSSENKKIDDKLKQALEGILHYL